MIYILPDLHIGGSLSRDARLKEDWLLFLQELQSKLEEVLNPGDAVIFPGDIFHTRKASGKEIRAFETFAARLNELGAWMFCIGGNHDNDEVLLAETRKVQHLKPHGFLYGELTIRGLDSMPAEKLKESLHSLEPCDLLVIHASFRHLLGFEGAWDLEMSDIPETVKNVAAGDIHVVDVRKLPHGKGSVGSPGVLHPQKISEDPPHGILCWDGENWGFFGIPCRRMRRFLYGYDDDGTLPDVAVQGFVSECSEDKYLPVVQLRYRSGVLEEAKALAASLEDSAVALLTPAGGAVESDNVISLKLDEGDIEEVTLETVLPEAVDREDERDVYSFLEESLRHQRQGTFREFVREQVAAVQQG